MATKYAGREFLLKVSGGGSPDEYTTVAALRSTSFSINQEQIDVTDKDDDAWRKLLEGGVRSVSISGAGILTNHASHERLLTLVTAGTITSYQIVFSSGRSITGQFQIASFEGSGEYTDAQQYSVTLESANTPTFDLTA